SDSRRLFLVDTSGTAGCKQREALTMAFDVPQLDHATLTGRERKADDHRDEVTGERAQDLSPGLPVQLALRRRHRAKVGNEEDDVVPYRTPAGAKLCQGFQRVPSTADG